MATYPWTKLDTLDINVGEKLFLGGVSGNPGEVIYNNGLPEWRKINQLSSKFTDLTSGVQDVGGGAVKITYDTVVFNDADIVPNATPADEFTFNQGGLY